MAPLVFGLVATLLLSTAAVAGKPARGGNSPPPNPEIAYRTLSGKSVKLMVANEDGTNATALYSSQTSFVFDLAPRAQRQIAISTGTGAESKLSLLSYTTTGSGTFATTGIVELTPARQGTRIDFSPDGTRIAYACCYDGSSETLAVYDLTDNSVTHWATGDYFWDIAWFRNGASIAFSTLGPTALYELDAPGAEPRLLYAGQGEINVDSSRVHPDRLVVSYNDEAGDARIGMFEAPTASNPEGGFVSTDIANSARAWQGTLNCDDLKLAYGGTQNTSGSQAYYILDLTTGMNTLVSKSANIMLQFWPTCS